MTKAEAKSLLKQQHIAKLNGVQSYTINGETLVYVGGKETLGDINLAKKYLQLKTLELVTIRHAGGLIQVSETFLDTLIEEMTCRGYELWEIEAGRDEEITNLDESSETFDSDVEEILSRSWE